MGDLQIKKQSKKYDAVIVGSGAGGGMAAYVLSWAGLKICLIEAGPMYDPAIHSSQLKNPWDSPRRGASTKFRPFGDFDGSYWGWEIDGEPYTKAEGTKWDWWRARMVGGRTNHWGRISLRFGPKDFKRRSIDGLGDDWPIGYEDIKPYYDKIDQLIGVFGTNEGLPNDPDGIFLPPPKPRLPRDEISGSASDAKVFEFIEFIVKDKPEFQTPMRGGLRWLNMQSIKLFDKPFKDIDEKQQLQLVDQIAYPEKVKSEFKQGAAFFTLMRNLTMSGFYTTEIGVKDIGYLGNRANQWNGVPDDVLKQYNIAYSEKELRECVRFEKE